MSVLTLKIIDTDIVLELYYVGIFNRIRFMVMSILLYNINQYNIIYYIADSHNSILDLVFCSDNLVEVKKYLKHLVLLDLFHLALNIPFL